MFSAFFLFCFQSLHNRKISPDFFLETKKNPAISSKKVNKQVKTEVNDDVKGGTKGRKKK